MLISKSKISKIVCLTGITLAFDLLFLGNSFPTQAKPSRNRANSVKVSYEGLPSNRRDGGSRGNCIAKGREFVALVPDRPVNVTASISSQLFFYVPQTESPKTIEFVVRTKEDQLVHEAFVQTTGQAGIMSVAIPDQVKENLSESYGDYHWYLSMICDPNHRSRDIVLEGWIEHVELNNSVKDRIELSTDLEKSHLLQQEGVWYDALSVIAELKKSDSDLISIQTEWSQLLESIGLGELASEPLIKAKTIDHFYSTSLKDTKSFYQNLP